MTSDDNAIANLRQFFSADGERIVLASAHALNWLTAGLVGGWVVNISMAETPNWFLNSFVLGAFLFSVIIRYYTLGIEQQIEIVEKDFEQGDS